MEVKLPTSKNVEYRIEISKHEKGELWQGICKKTRDRIWVVREKTRTKPKEHKFKNIDLACNLMISLWEELPEKTKKKYKRKESHLKDEQNYSIL